MLEPLRRLCGRLERELDGSLLALPLDALDGAIVEEAARELLRHAYEAGVASTLYEVARDTSFVRWVEETCSAREGAILFSALARLLGTRDDVGGDDPARLAVVDTAPSHEPELRAWATRHGISGELTRSAPEALGDARLPLDLTLLACVCAEHESQIEQESLLESADMQAEAARYLTRLARARAALGVREALWRKRPEGPLRALVERLVAVLGETTVFDLHPLAFATARPVKLQAEIGTCSGTLKSPLETPPVEAQIELAGFEQRALYCRCSACDAQPCPHTRALAGRLLDACLSAEDRLHAELSRFVARPSWQLFFERVEARAQWHGQRAQEGGAETGLVHAAQRRRAHQRGRATTRARQRARPA